MRNIVLAMIVVILSSSSGYCQNAQNFMGEIDKFYNNSGNSDNDLIVGFSLAGLIGGMIFGSIGFIAFIYGKKMSEFKPMLMGILLMLYPYFVRNTVALYMTGVVLTVFLFIWRMKEGM